MFSQCFGVNYTYVPPLPYTVDFLRNGEEFVRCHWTQMQRCHGHVSDLNMSVFVWSSLKYTLLQGNDI